MRTRRQEQVEAEPEPAAVDTQDGKRTVVSITKVEGPTVAPAKSAQPTSKLPKPLQFPLVAVLSLALSALGYSLLHPYTKGVLADRARVLSTWEDIGLLTAWRITELALAWFGNYDGYDLAALNVLSHGPALYLLSAFYKMPPQALLLTLTIETVSTYIPFRLLRPLSAAHAAPDATPNAEIVQDRPIALLTTLLAGGIYSVTLFAAYATYLPTYLIVYFDKLPSLEAAHQATYVGLLPVTLALGFAARVFIFTPAEAATGEDQKEFDPVTATLGETVSWNFWGWSSQTKVVIQRTAVLILITSTNTFLQTWKTVEGVEPTGAAAWASVWAFAALVTGIALGAVGGN